MRVQLRVTGAGVVAVRTAPRSPPVTVTGGTATCVPADTGVYFEVVVEYMRSLPTWQARVAAVHTIPRELRASETYRFDPKRFGDLEVPTLLLLGGNSPTIFEDVEKVVAEALPNARIVVMPGQGHVAIDTATDPFTTEVLQVVEGT